MANFTDAHLEGDTLHLNLKIARLDASIARGFKKECEAAWTDEVKAVVMDLGCVEFIDSSGIGALLNVYKKLPPGTPSARLVNVTPSVQSVIELLRLHRIFELEA
jgi:anti-sigma B factor antagonist